MKTKKENKLKKRQFWRYNSPLIFLVFSIALAVTIVACNKDFMETPEPDATNKINSSYAGINGTNQVGELASFVFEQLSIGLLRKVGDAGMGWLLGSVGIAQQDGASTQEVAAALGEINAKLTVMNNKLGKIVGELSTIGTEISKLACMESELALDDNVSWISTLMEEFNQMAAQAADSNAVTDAHMQSFVDRVLNGGTSSSEKDMATILNDFAVHLFQGSDGGLMTVCLDNGAIKLPKAGFGTDEAYYNQVSKITTYYYGYYASGLLLYFEANNYNSYKIASSNYGLDSTFTTVSIATICNIPDPEIIFNCGLNLAKDTTAYNDLKKIFTMGGAPYTNDYQILNYKSSSSHILWARSIEKYNEDVNANCPDPFIYNILPCGPLQGFYNKVLQETTYRKLDGWEFADAIVLQTLFPNTVNVVPSSTVGKYLEDSVGFENLVGTGKVVMAYQNYGNHYGIPLAGSGGTASGQQGLHELYVIPFFYVDMWASNGLIIKPSDFNSIFQRYQYGDRYLCKYHSYDYWCTNYRYHHIPALTTCDDFATCEWFVGYGTVSLRGGGYIEEFFAFTDFTYENHSNNSLPGWLKYRQVNSADLPALLWPINFIANPTCLPGRNVTNAGGMITMCGDDFTDWLNIILPPLDPSLYN